MHKNTKQQIQQTLQQQLESLSINPKYQKILVTFLLICVLLDSITLLSTMLIFMNPLFICNGQSKTQAQACPIIDQCQITNSFTAVYYTGLYCSNQNMRSIVQASIFVGQIVSFLFIVPMSDSIGRRKILVIGYGMLATGSIIQYIGIQTKIYALIIAGTFINGLFLSISHVVTYVITSQFCTSKQCQYIFVFYCGIWSIAQIGFFPIYYLIPQWNNFLILFMIIPAIGVFVISTFLLLESPTFYLSVKRDITKFSTTIENIAMYNKASIENIHQIRQTAQIYLQITQNISEEKPSFKQSVITLTKNKKFLITCLCLALSQSGFNIYYMNMQGSMERTGFNFGISMFLAGIHEAIAFTVFAFIGYRLPRKNGLILTISVSSLIGLTFLLPFVKNSEIFQSIVISVARILTVFSFSFYKYLQTESFPNAIMSTAMGTIQGLCQIAMFFVPFIINSMNDIGIHPIIFASISYLIVGLAPLTCISQTRKKQQKKQQSLEQQQNSISYKQTIEQNLINASEQEHTNSIN